MPRVELVAVEQARRPALEGLVDAYLAELATHRERPVGPTFAADYVYLPLYWTEAGRYPFTIEAEGETAGFVLVRQVQEDGRRVSQMSDFYVLPALRRRGTAHAAVAALWRAMPGEWELQVHVRNEAAMHFWPAAIARHAEAPVTRRDVEEDDGRRIEYRFRVGAGGKAAV